LCDLVFAFRSEPPLHSFSFARFSSPSHSPSIQPCIFRSVHSLQTSFFVSTLLAVAVVSPVVLHFTALSGFVRSVVAQLARRPLFSGPVSMRARRPVFVRSPCGGSGLQLLPLFLHSTASLRGWSILRGSRGAGAQC
jgi:hypothetical protein